MYLLPPVLNKGKSQNVFDPNLDQIHLRPDGVSFNMNDEYLVIYRKKDDYIFNAYAL